MKNKLSAIIIAIIFSSCEKVVDLKYKDNESKIIIEGNISNEAGPYIVRINNSIKLTESGAYPAIDNAVVTISDDLGNSETLVSEGKGMYSTNTLRGAEGRTYTLHVKHGSEVYTAQSKMPKRVAFDTIKVEELNFGGEIERNLIPVYNDPVENGNNYRFVVTVNNKLYKAHLIQNDKVRNGMVNTQRLEINNDDIELLPGDQVSITMQCIDNNVAVFYTTLALAADSGPGGGTHQVTRSIMFRMVHWDCFRRIPRRQKKSRFDRKFSSEMFV